MAGSVVVAVAKGEVIGDDVAPVEGVATPKVGVGPPAVSVGVGPTAGGVGVGPPVGGVGVGPVGGVGVGPVGGVGVGAPAVGVAVGFGEPPLPPMLLLTHALIADVLGS